MQWLRKTKIRLHQCGTGVLPGILEDVGDLTTADWHDIENNLASEVHVKRFKSKEVGIKQLQKSIRMSLRRWLHKTTRSPTTSEYTSPETLYKAQGSDSLQKERGVADFSEADCDVVAARGDFWSMSGEFTYRHHIVPTEQVYVPKES